MQGKCRGIMKNVEKLWKIFENVCKIMKNVWKMQRNYRYIVQKYVFISCSNYGYCTKILYIVEIFMSL